MAIQKKPTKFFSYTKGTDLQKGNKSRGDVSFSKTKIKEEPKSKWQMSDTGAVRTKVSFPKSNKATVGRPAGLMTKKRSQTTSTGKAKNILM